MEKFHDEISGEQLQESLIKYVPEIISNMIVDTEAITIIETISQGWDRFYQIIESETGIGNSEHLQEDDEFDEKLQNIFDDVMPLVLSDENIEKIKKYIEEITKEVVSENLNQILLNNK